MFHMWGWFFNHVHFFLPHVIDLFNYIFLTNLHVNWRSILFVNYSHYLHCLLVLAFVVNWTGMCITHNILHKEVSTFTWPTPFPIAITSSIYVLGLHKRWNPLNCTTFCFYFPIASIMIFLPTPTSICCATSLMTWYASFWSTITSFH